MDEQVRIVTRYNMVNGQAVLQADVRCAQIPWVCLVLASDGAGAVLIDAAQALNFGTDEGRSRQIVQALLRSDNMHIDEDPLHAPIEIRAPFENVNMTDMFSSILSKYLFGAHEGLIVPPNLGVTEIAVNVGLFLTRLALVGQPNYRFLSIPMKQNPDATVAVPRTDLALLVSRVATDVVSRSTNPERALPQYNNFDWRMLAMHLPAI